jgi:hypothetical protein
MAPFAPYFVYAANKLSEQILESRMLLLISSRNNSIIGADWQPSSAVLALANGCSLD